MLVCEVAWVAFAVARGLVGKCFFLMFLGDGYGEFGEGVAFYAAAFYR